MILYPQGVARSSCAWPWRNTARRVVKTYILKKPFPCHSVAGACPGLDPGWLCLFVFISVHLLAPPFYLAVVLHKGRSFSDGRWFHPPAISPFRPEFAGAKNPRRKQGNQGKKVEIVAVYPKSGIIGGYEKEIIS